MDYFFMSQEDEAASKNPILVVIDEEKRARFARCVSKKGLGEQGEMDWIVKEVVKELKSWGRHGGHKGEIILKSDSEPAIVQVRDAAAKYMGGRCILQSPPVGGE